MSEITDIRFGEEEGTVLVEADFDSGSEKSVVIVEGVRTNDYPKQTYISPEIGQTYLFSIEQSADGTRLLKLPETGYSKKDTFTVFLINDDTRLVIDSAVKRGSGFSPTADAQFAGYSHESLPDVDLDFSCKSPNGKQPEAVVDIKHNGLWVRLPITRVETRLNKDGPANITTSSRVDCPVTWGVSEQGDEKVPIYEYVGAAQKQDNAEFDLARVYYWNKYRKEYSIEQFGYVASIGPSEQNGVFRFYVYDAADILKNVPVTATYDSPTASKVINTVLLSLKEDGPFGSGVRYSTTNSGEQVELDGKYETMDTNVAGWLNKNVPILKFHDKESGTANMFREFVDDTLHTGGHKHFRRNRHTMVDVMNWLTDEIGGAWYFEPYDEGVILMIHNEVEDDSFNIPRSAYYDGQFDPDGLEYIQGFNPAPVDVINNSSLEDLKPINHLELNGESQDSFLGINADRFDLDGPLGAARGHTNKYPHVEVTYPPLLNRTGGKKLGPKPIESGKTTLAEAREQAVKEFKKAHEDNTDGSIEIRALPSIRPYDYMAAVPVCNDTFDANMNPIQYEVNTVVHKVSAEEPYITSLGVSIALNEDALKVKDQYLEINPND